MKAINYIVGDATAPIGGDTNIIAHVCNDLGRWGKGFVLALSNRWREPQEQYMAWYRGEIPGLSPFQLGKVQYVPVGDQLWVANIIGQHGLMAKKNVPPVRYEAIREGLSNVANFAKERGALVHMPRIGCGLAGGTWERIRTIIEETLSRADVAVVVYDLPTQSKLASNVSQVIADRRMTHVSKFLSLVLRHKPETVGIILDEGGWVPVADLLAACAAHDFPITREELLAVIATSDKQRFALSEDGEQIRANQGHSVPVELGYAPADPPELLYHGTPERFVESIRREGLTKQKRHHVHLSEDMQQTIAVGARRGKPVLLRVRADEMRRAGHAFFRTPNNVWLTDAVPPAYIEFPVATSDKGPLDA